MMIWVRAVFEIRRAVSFVEASRNFEIFLKSFFVQAVDVYLSC